MAMNGIRNQRVVWIGLAFLTSVALVLSSCQAAPATPTEGQTVKGQVTTPAATGTQDTQNAAATPAAQPTTEEGPDMVTDVKGRLVEKPRYGGTINLARSSDPIAFDPFRHIQGPDSMGAIFEKMRGGDWSIDRSQWDFTNDYIPMAFSRGYLAEGWDNPDPLTYIIYVREGVRFQDKPPVNGRELTAEDIKYSYDRITGLGEFAEVGGSPWVTYGENASIESIEVNDKYTLTLHHTNASPLFPEFFGTEGHIWIHPREAVEAGGDNFEWRYAIGTGPFEVEDVVPGSSIDYVRNPTYWGWNENFPDDQVPYIDGIRQLIIPDQSTVLAALRTGKVDNIPGVNWMDAESLQQQNPDLQWKKLLSVCLVTDLRTDLKPYDDINVRKAMQMAIDLKGMADDYYGGTADPFPNMVSPGYTNLYTPLEEFPEDVQEAFQYNPEKARELLTAAGYPTGFKQSIPLSSAASPETRELTDLFIAYWDAIGIDTEINSIESAAYSSFTYGRQHEIAWIWSCGTWMPTEILHYWYGGTTVPWNFSNADDPYFNSLEDQVRAEPDAAERDRIMKEAFVYGTSQFFYVATPIRVVYNFWQPWVKGYQGERSLGTVNRLSFWSRVWIDQDLKFEQTGQR